MTAIIEVDTPLGHFRCYEDTVGRALRSGQFWDQQIQPFLDEADPSGVAIDIGANIGWFSVYLGRRHSRVYAVEAHPQTFELLQENTAGMSHIICLSFAAYDCAAHLALATGAEVGWDWDGSYDLESCPHPASIVYRPVSAGQTTVRWGLRLDLLISPHDRVTVIKVDAQGCDLRALRGLVQTIRRCRPLIVFEYEDTPSRLNGTCWQDYLDFFAELSYTVERIRGDLWDFVARPK